MSATTSVKRGVFVVGCAVLAAGCGTAATTGQHTDKPAPTPAIKVSSKLPAPISGNGWSFASYTSQDNFPKLVSADVALAAAKATGIDSEAWTNGTTPTATLVEHTNTYRGIPATPAWIIHATNVPIQAVGPVMSTSTNPPHFTGIAEWIINARTGNYIAAGDEGSPS